MCTVSLRPTQDRIIVKRIDSETVSKGGILIPDTVQEKPQRGRVIAVGPGSHTPEGVLIPIYLEVGQEVLFGKWSGTEVNLEGETYLIMKESDIMAVVEPLKQLKAA